MDAGPALRAAVSADLCLHRPAGLTEAGGPAFAPPGIELILGGQKSGKSRTAESRAAVWLARPAAEGRPAPEAWLVATAQAGDPEMARRIERHRLDRLARVPTLLTLEQPNPLALARTLVERSAPHRLLVVDCLMLWLTQLAWPLAGQPPGEVAVEAACGELVAALRRARGPVVLVSNEIGLGLTPLGADVRQFLDHLGCLHQDVAAISAAVTLMVAGCEMPVKRRAPAHAHAHASAQTLAPAHAHALGHALARAPAHGPLDAVAPAPALAQADGPPPTAGRRPAP